MKSAVYTKAGQVGLAEIDRPHESPRRPSKDGLGVRCDSCCR